jgi:hypothetical protein
MWLWTVSGASLATASIMLTAGCASTCRANPEKLAALQRGMSYPETARIMGCDGKVTSSRAPTSGEMSTVEWDGPGPILMATQADFRDDRLLYYITKARGGF